jgi:hypothetical protein
MHWLSCTQDQSIKIVSTKYQYTYVEVEEEEAEKVLSVNLNFYGVAGMYVEQWRACPPSVVIWFVMCLWCGLSELLAI